MWNQVGSLLVKSRSFEPIRSQMIHHYGTSFNEHLLTTTELKLELKLAQATAMPNANVLSFYTHQRRINATAFLKGKRKMEHRYIPFWEYI